MSFKREIDNRGLRKDKESSKKKWMKLFRNEVCAYITQQRICYLHDIESV
jgi:hypothetical protein